MPIQSYLKLKGGLLAPRIIVNISANISDHVCKQGGGGGYYILIVGSAVGSCIVNLPCHAAQSLELLE